jgi:hypothetical protein
MGTVGPGWGGDGAEVEVYCSVQEGVDSEPRYLVACEVVMRYLGTK